LAVSSMKLLSPGVSAMARAPLVGLPIQSNQALDRGILCRVESKPARQISYIVTRK
jgi:hypothetical protein